ncbi:MAG: TldD/PmbA family protein [Desulfurococcales archaeon]|nr:TldD/PmbA family protein [Desulfurococcales archaeon]
MNLEEFAKKLVENIKGHVPEYIVQLEAENSVMLKLANGKPSVTQSWSEISVNLYFAKDGKMTVSSFRTSSPDEAIEKSIQILDKLTPSPLYAPLPESNGAPYWLVDENVKEMAISGDISQMISDLSLTELTNSAGAITLSYKSQLLAGSNGAWLKGESTSFQGYLRIFRGDDASGQWSWTSTRYEPGKAKKAIEKAVELAETCQSLPQVKLETGNYKVLLSPMIVGNLLQYVTMAASGASMIFGMSFFRPDDIKQPVASEQLSIIDDPHNEDLPGYRLFDDEGIKTFRKHILNRGILENILHNSKTARLLGGETTGNAGIIQPTPFNIIVEPGDIKEEELLEALGDGIYATNNWYTRFQNYVEGTFSTVTRDALLLVRGGKPVGCSKRARITGSLRDLIRNIVGLGKELWPIQWWEVSIPSLLPHIIVKTRITAE